MKRHGFTLFFLALLLAASQTFAVTVVIDAGHGGHDRGGSPGQRIPEKPYALDIARRLSSELRARGFRSVDAGLRTVTPRPSHPLAFLALHLMDEPTR